MIDEILDAERLGRQVRGIGALVGDDDLSRRLVAAASPIWPIPTTSVDSTKGPMIILISLRKMPLTSDMYLAMSAAVAWSGNE